jgi:hypothetical protein
LGKKFFFFAKISIYVFSKEMCQQWAAAIAKSLGHSVLANCALDFGSNGKISSEL